MDETKTDQAPSFAQFAQQSAETLGQPAEEKKVEPTQEAPPTPLGEVKKETRDLKAISLDQLGVLAPKDSNEEWRFASLMLQSRALPQQYQHVPQVMMATQMLRQLGLPPAVAIRQTCIINGSISLWGELPKALCERGGEIEAFEERFYDKAYNAISLANKNLDSPIWGVTCFVTRKGKPQIERSFTVVDAKQAGLLDASGKLYGKYLRRMLQMRARSWALKDAFPDVLSGVAIAEYDHGVIPDMTPEPTNDLPREYMSAAQKMKEDLEAQANAEREAIEVGTVETVSDLRAAQ